MEPQLQIEPETRAMPGCEVRIVDDGDTPRITGYAAVFDKWSPDYGGFREIVRPGAFTATLAEKWSDVRGLFNHEPDNLLGRETAGTMTLKEDAKGLFYDIPLGETTISRDVAAMIRRGDITGSSFSFTVRKEGDLWECDKDGGSMMERELLALDLYDVGPVTFPFYPQTKAAVRSLELFRRAQATRCFKERAKVWDRIFSAGDQKRTTQVQGGRVLVDTPRIVV